MNKDLSDTIATPPEPEGEGGPGSALVSREELNLRIFSSIRRVIRSIEIYSKRLGSAHGITGPQLVCLRQILESGPISTKKLSDLVSLSPSTLVGIIDRLEAKGLVERERSREDRRLVWIRVTPAGTSLAGRAPSPLQDALATALGSVPELEHLSITMALERVVSLMEIEGVDTSPMLAPGLNIEHGGDAAKIEQIDTGIEETI